jgi:hypothetical protein
VDGSYKFNHIKLTISNLTFNCPSKWSLDLLISHSTWPSGASFPFMAIGLISMIAT